MKKTLLIGLFLLWIAESLHAQNAQEKTIRGQIISAEDQSPLPGAAIVLKGTTKGTVTDADGMFSITVPVVGDQVLMVSFVGFVSQELRTESLNADLITLRLSPDNIQLDGVEVLSTGYQQLPRERATGSFAYLDEPIITRRVSTGILDRLEDITPGLIFNRDRTTPNDISIRGTSTIFAESRPLIVVDQFPYDGPIESINPNDVESITVLKDAAAASIWGARAGNGVIVITTKSGRAGERPRVSFTSNFTGIQETDPYYLPEISSKDLVAVEKEMFSRGIYTARENSRNLPLLSPAIETLILLRDGKITQQEADSRLAAYSSHNYRDELARYYYRPAFQQQYALGIRGGADRHRYSISLGYDKNLSGIEGNDNSRWTANLKNDWNLIQNRLQIKTGLYLANGKNNQRTSLPQGLSAPYVRLADLNGNPAALARSYREPFLNQAESNGLLDWKYYPLAELGQETNEREFLDLRANLNLSFKILEGWTMDALYQYWTNTGRTWELQTENSFYTRDLINTFTQVATNGAQTLAIPRGSIADLGESRSQSDHLRIQTSFNRTVNQRHDWAAIVGLEIKSLDTETNSSRYYGYDEELGASLGVDYVTRFRRYHNASLVNIPYRNNHTGLSDRFLSYYANASYTLDKKYTLSASARKDASNLFGVESNQKGVPLWSIGGSWTLSEESFYSSGALPYLRLRTTFGYNGNVDRGVSAYTTAYLLPGSFNNLTRLPSYAIQNPPNPELRWERVKTVNFALDFETKDGGLSGSMDYYFKQGLDLIGDQPFPSSTGVTLFRGNFANTQTQGLDLLLRYRVINRGVRWNQTLLFNWLKEEVTSYEVQALPVQYTNYGFGGSGTFPAPLKGYPLFSVFAYPWAGLDPANGNPLGLFEGQPTTNYNAIINSTPIEELVYMGPARPNVFGSWMNTISWKGWSFSANISYRLGYFVRRQPLIYNSLYQGGTVHEDYARRWQKPGDELITQVPSFPMSQVSNRDNFYNRSEIMVVKGDHIRLQDIRVSYTLQGQRLLGLPFAGLEMYAYANNLGILWKKTDEFKDPDFRTVQALTSLSIGLKADF